MKTAQQVYDKELRGCPRSAEWLAGALSGVQKAAKEPHSRLPYPPGTCQADAWEAGFQVGYREWKWQEAEASATKRMQAVEQAAKGLV